MRETKQKIKLYFFVLLLAQIFSCRSDPTVVEKEEQEKPKVINQLPFQKIDLVDLSAFSTKGKNWKIVEDVYSDLDKKHHMDLTDGLGILVNQQTDTERAHLFTGFEHGDLELEVEFLMPKGSNSGIYFQSRYEIQLFDSYGVDEMEVKDCGSIYQRWDESRPEGKKGFEGHPSKVNASKAPGLWQHYKIYFRAPRFDANGKKIKNASFEHVYHNGLLIHENVELKGTTRAAPVKIDDEVPYAPLMIQGDHGPVAFRNFKYKAYNPDSLTLSNVQYKLYELPEEHKGMPEDWKSLKLVDQGTTDLLDITPLNDTLEDYFAMQFEADLQVDVPGEYVFNTSARNSAMLFIDDKLVVNQNGKNWGHGLINLTEGTHKLKLDFFHLKWLHYLFVGYEGPGIQKQNFPNEVPPRPWDKKVEPVTLLAKKETEVLRSFIMRDGKKRTHCISVGDPEGLNFSYDLSEASILRLWKGDFLDVTEMWHSRGEPQLANPLNAFVEGVNGVPIAELSNMETPWTATEKSPLQYKGYQLNEKDQAIFKYNFDSATIEDRIEPSKNNNGLTRYFSIKNNPSKALYLRLARANKISKVPNGFYNIGGDYYMNIDAGMPEPILRTVDGKQELLLPIAGDGTFSYDFIW